MDVAEAARFTLERARGGEDTISVTGNVLRDYLTDLFPILERGHQREDALGRAADGRRRIVRNRRRRLGPPTCSAVPKENHLRWDSLGEFLALVPSLELLAKAEDNQRARILADTLDRATGRVLEDDRSPRREVGELDNRGSHFYLALYWAQELAAQDEDSELAERFSGLAEQLAESEERIVEELDDAQGSSVDIGGYYRPDPELMAAAMRPSEAFSDAVSDLAEGAAKPS